MFGGLELLAFFDCICSELREALQPDMRRFFDVITAISKTRLNQARLAWEGAPYRRNDSLSCNYFGYGHEC